MSDTFGSALWVLDYMFALAHADAAGVNMETGVNQLGFISSYSPIGEDEQGTYLAKPEYYGMLAFAHASQGQRVALDYDTADVNLKAYAVLSRHGRISVTLVNKDAFRDADVRVIVKGDFTRVNALRLTGPSLASPDGVRLGGSAVAANGSWQPALEESLRTRAASARSTYLPQARQS